MIELITVFVLLASIVILVKSADFVVGAAAKLAKQFGVTDYLLGFLVIAFGTSLPELVTAIFGSIEGEGHLVVGNMLGACILDATVVLGILAIAARRLHITGKMFRTFDRTLIMTLFMLLLPFGLGLNGTLSRIDGIVLVIAYLAYLVMLIKREENYKHDKIELNWTLILKNSGILLLAFPFLLVSAKFLVDAAVQTADSLGLPKFIVGIILVSMGTTLPELTVNIRSAFKGVKEIGFGNVFGSIITNITLILGVGAIINPMTYPLNTFLTAALFMITSTFVALLFLEKETVTWKEGLALLFIYATFVISIGLEMFL